MWLLYHDGATAADQILVTAVHLAAVPDFPYFAGIELVGFDYVGPDLVWVMADLTHLPPNPNKVDSSIFNRFDPIFERFKVKDLISDGFEFACT